MHSFSAILRGFYSYALARGLPVRLCFSSPIRVFRLFTELCSAGTLADLAPLRPSEGLVRQFTHDLVQALIYLHERVSLLLFFPQSVTAHAILGHALFIDTV
ncbi:unnamed protein product [Protopolystoma xenopodis]|uniref:Protein kinase domain-containing protein n=1 Tax=Protopolystoma xenopodis TaxID=117903 RepID=A0A448X0P9_9PLAT|nr:unnamed protein product [Protopolystoma xenopodis]